MDDEDKPTAMPNIVPDNIDLNDYTSSVPEDYSAEKVTAQWRADALLQHLAGGSVILGDAVAGDGLRDVMSPQLVESFESLMGEDVDTYEEARDLIAEKMASGDEELQGLLYKVQGQIGEDRFVGQMQEAGVEAELAEMGNQQGYDVVVSSLGGTERFVQVKTYADAGDAVEKIEDTQGALHAGEVTTPEGQVVEEIEYAVPSNIAGDVEAGLGESGVDVILHSLDTSAEQAAEIAQTGVQTGVLSPDVLGDFLAELAGVGIASATIHSAAEALLVYKGAKEGMNLHKVAEETTITVAAAGVGMGVEGVLVKSSLGGGPAFAITLAATLLARGVFKGIARRGDYARWVAAQGQYTDELATQVRSL